MARTFVALQLFLVAAMVAVASAQYEDDSVGTVFFLTSDLHPGSKMTLHFTRPAAGAGASITLPSAARAAADYSSVPFTSAMFPEILSRLSVPSGSPAAAAIRATLAQCEAAPAPVGAEALHCVTSYRSMVDFAAASLGTRDIRAARTKIGTANGEAEATARPRLTYEMEAVQRVPVAGGDMVACHRLPYPYDVFACHTTDAAVYAVSLAGADGRTRAQALAACHADAFPGISAQAYEKLGVEPGSAPVCHFLPQNSTLWMRNSQEA